MKYQRRIDTPFSETRAHLSAARSLISVLTVTAARSISHGARTLTGSLNDSRRHSRPASRPEFPPRARRRHLTGRCRPVGTPALRATQNPKDFGHFFTVRLGTSDALVVALPNFDVNERVRLGASLGERV